MPTLARIRFLAAVAVYDPPAREIVRRELDVHPVTGQDPDTMLAKLSGDLGQDLVVLVSELDINAEDSAWVALDDSSGDFYALFFCHTILDWVPRRESRSSMADETLAGKSC